MYSYKSVVAQCMVHQYDSVSCHGELLYQATRRISSDYVLVNHCAIHFVIMAIDLRFNV